MKKLLAQKQNGITLVALVITIIILLILAGISIATLTGDNGLFAKAREAKTKTEEGQNTENKTLLDYEEHIAEVIDGPASEIVVPKITATGNLADTTKVTEVREGNIPIPVGFTYVKGTKKAGAVITDGTSEFVRVPVDDINKMAVLKTDSTTDYRGVLYDWNTDITGNTEYEWNTSSIGNREPAYLIKADASTSNNIELTEGSLQTEYNTMVLSVKKYAGFYVGRYETSFNGTTPQSKKGEKSSTAADDLQTWYGLYSKQKNYAVGSTQGQMIWGSQYDAMLKWMKKNSINVTSDTPIENAIKNTTRMTGTEEKDKLNNIYDILGNSREWTTEARNIDGRIRRGGYYNDTIAPSNRLNFGPSDNAGSAGSRLALYIK